MSKLKVTQVRSVIHRPKDQKQTVRRIGLHRIRHSVIKDDRPEIPIVVPTKATRGHPLTEEQEAANRVISASSAP